MRPPKASNNAPIRTSMQPGACSNCVGGVPHWLSFTIIFISNQVQYTRASGLNPSKIGFKHAFSLYFSMRRVGLKKVTAPENATTGVTCNAIDPGWVLTRFDPWTAGSDDHGGCGAILHTEFDV